MLPRERSFLFNCIFCVFLHIICYSWENPFYTVTRRVKGYILDSSESMLQVEGSVYKVYIFLIRITSRSDNFFFRWIPRLFKYFPPLLKVQVKSTLCILLAVSQYMYIRRRHYFTSDRLLFFPREQSLKKL